MPTSSALSVQCFGGKFADWNFPAEIDAAKISTVAPLTLGVVTAKRVTVETPYTDTITTPEGDETTGVRQRKAVCVFKHTPVTGDPRIHRISIPAPDMSGDTGIYMSGDNGGKIPASQAGAGKDGNDLADLFKAAMNLDGTFVFLSGRVNTRNTKSA